MKPFQSTPDQRAFVKLHSFQKVLAWFRRETSLAAPGGDVAQLPNGGKAVRFHSASSLAPFTATNSGGGIHLAAGFIAWAGRTIYFPEATYSGPKPGGVFIKLPVNFIATANAPGDPWDIIIDEDDTRAPTLVWRHEGQWIVPGITGIGAHARIMDTDASSAESITVTEGTVYLPVATQYGSKIVQDFATAIDLYFISSGSVRLSERPGN